MFLFGTPAFAQPAASPAPAALPQVLSPDDQQRYRQIFEDERGGRFAEADALSAQLTDKSLMGYVQAEHYPVSYTHLTLPTNREV